MRVLKALLLILMLGSLALAQAPQQSPAEQALAAKLLQEINVGLQCAQQTITLQQQLAAVTKERDEAKEQLHKQEPAKE